MTPADLGLTDFDYNFLMGVSGIVFTTIVSIVTMKLFI